MRPWRHLEAFASLARMGHAQVVEDRTLPRSSKALMSRICTYRYLISRWAEIGPGRWFDGVCCERKSAQKTPTLDEGNAAQRCGFLSAPPFSALATATSKTRGRSSLAAPELLPHAHRRAWRVTYPSQRFHLETRHITSLKLSNQSAPQASSPLPSWNCHFLSLYSF